HQHAVVSDGQADVAAASGQPGHLGLKRMDLDLLLLGRDEHRGAREEGGEGQEHAGESELHRIPRRGDPVAPFRGRRARILLSRPVSSPDPWPSLFHSTPINSHLGMRLVRADAEGAEVRLAPEAFFLQEAGVIHGGILTTLADTAAVYSLLPALPRERTLIGI